MQAEAQRSQLTMLDGQVSEPARLTPDMGRYLQKAFPADTTILCNFDRYYSTLSYYAQRTILRNVGTADEWKDALDDSERLGGILWMGAPSTPEILAVLPKDEVQQVEIDGIRFAVWRPGRLRAHLPGKFKTPGSGQPLSGDNNKVIVISVEERAELVRLRQEALRAMAPKELTDTASNEASRDSGNSPGAVQ
jgi:hypothetical protein